MNLPTVFLAMLLGGPARAGWEDFRAAFPALPCQDGWAGCLVDGRSVNAELQPDSQGLLEPSDLRLGWFDLQPTATFSPFVGFSDYAVAVASAATPAETPAEEARSPDGAASPPESEAGPAEPSGRAAAGSGTPTPALQFAGTPQPGGALHEPVVAQAEPEPVEPEPAAAQAEPEPVHPEPVVAQPGPGPSRPEPVAAQAEPSRPEPVAAQAGPSRPEPVAAQTGPSRPEPGPEPAAAQAEPEPEPAAAQAEPEAQAEPAADDGVALAGSAKAVTCDDLVALEPAALMGQLSPAQRQCLEDRIGRASRQTEKDKISRVLLMDAEARGDRKEWARLMKRHLESIDRSDPDLCFKYAIFLSHQGVSRAQGVIRWADYALENKSRWTGATYKSRVYALLKLKAEAAARLWEKADKAYVENRTDENEALSVKYRNMTKDFAREWLDYARASGQSTKNALALCISAAGSREFCEGD